MSQVTTTYTTGYDLGLVRDVDGAIGLFSPTDTPFIANMKTEKGTQRKSEWMEDELREPAKNAQVEGADVTTTESQAPDFDDNVMQIFRKEFSLSGTAKVVEMYGRPSNDLNRQKGLRAKELARDIEWACLNGVRKDGSSSVAREMDGAFAFVDTTTDRFYSFDDTPASTNHVTEDNLLGVAQAIWDAGVSPDTVLCPMAQKRKISAFTDKGRLTINQDAVSKKVTMAVRIIETDMGTMTVMAERFIEPTTDIGKEYDKLLVYKKSIFARKILRPIKTEMLAKTGDNEKGYMITELTLKCATDKGVGAMTNLSREKVA